MKEFAKAFYHSRSWKNIREFVFTRDKGLCQRCMRHNRYKPGMIVHHKNPLTPDNIDDPSIALDADNLELVCKECHEEIHKHLGYGALNSTTYEPRVRFDSKGNVISI